MKNVNLSFLNQELSIGLTIAWFIMALLTIFLFLRAVPNPKSARLILFSWLIFQSILALNGFFLKTIEIPQILLVGVGLPNLFAISMLFFGVGRKFIDSLDLQRLTFFHIIRVPVELLILWLFLENQMPQLMTFEGRNWDILSGITAPIIAFWAFREVKTHKNVLLVWNLICLGLLFNIVINAILSAPLPIQQQAFEQPNVGVLKFAANLLPSLIVPLVLFGHLAAITRLVRK